MIFSEKLLKHCFLILLKNIKIVEKHNFELWIIFKKKSSTFLFY